jgi:thiamine biosynthesis lipoprotein
VGKGWALDRVAATLRVRGVFRALLTAAGSSHCGWGGEPWELALRPRDEDLGLLRLRDAALGTSAAGEQHFEVGYGHVLDPRTGWPAEGVKSATVVASEAAGIRRVEASA